MAQTIKLRRSATEGAVPTTGQLALGEVAINTFDGKMYIKKDVSGTEAIVTIGEQVALDIASAIMFQYKFIASANQTAFSGADQNSNTLTYTANAIEVFLNGVLLEPTVDYVATNGITITLVNGADASDVLWIIAFKRKIADGDASITTASGNGSTTAFTLGVDPANENNTNVYIDGVYQAKGTYSVSGTTLTFSTAPPDGSSIEFVIGSRDVSISAINNFTAEGNITAEGNLSVEGNTTLGNAATDTVTITADVASHILPSADGTYDLGAAASEWKDLYIDGTAFIDTLTLTSGASVTVIEDQDDMSSNSATALATQQSIKAYVDAQILTEDTLAELNDTNITTPADASLLLYDTGTSTWRDAALSGDVTITDVGVATVGTLNQSTTGSAATLTTARTIGGTSFNGSADIAVALATTVTTNANLTGDVTSVGNATAIGTGVIIDADVKSDAAIAYSKLGTIPTWNQNTTGSAATLTTARTIGGVSFNGSADINLPGVNAAGTQTSTGLTGTPAITVGAITSGAIGANSGATNIVGTFTSTDAGAGIRLADNTGTAVLETVGADLFIRSDPTQAVGSSTIKFDIDGSTKATLTTAGNLDIVGDLTVGGTTTTLNTATLTVDDKNLELG